MNRRLLILFVVVSVSIILFVNLLLNVRLRRVVQREFDQLSGYANTLLQNLSSGVLSVNVSLEIQSINKMGLQLLNLGNRPVLHQAIAVLPEPLPGMIKQSLSQNQPSFANTTIRMVDGSVLEIRMNVIHEEDPVCILILDDVTHKVRLEAETRRNQRLTAMRDLAASVAHEIKNPLNGINLLIGLIKKKCQPQQELEPQFATIEEEIHRIGHIVDEYLRWARPLPIERKPVQIEPLMQSVVGLFEQQFKQEQIQWDVKIDDTTLMVDADQLKQVLINLIKNAKEAMESGGTLIISGKPEGPCYTIKLADTGSGIAEEDIPRIFDFYYTTKKEGSGIGLAVVQQIVTAHNGQIEIESQKGKGTEVIIHLPLSDVACE